MEWPEFFLYMYTYVGLNSLKRHPDMILVAKLNPLTVVVSPVSVFSMPVA